MKQVITTSSAPAAIGAYSQAIAVGTTVYLSGQIALDPTTQVLCSEDISLQIRQVISHLEGLCVAAGGTLAQIVKMTVYLMDLSHFSLLNETMAEYFSQPYPARAVVQVAGLPRGAKVEIDAILDLNA